MNRNPITQFKKGHIPWNKGKKGLQKHSKKTKQKISKTHKGLNIWSKGRKQPKEEREKRSKILKGKYLKEKNPNWRGGTSFEPYDIDWTDTLKRSIRERDHYICQLCNQYGNVVHHIDYDKKNCDPKNLITLCQKCNSKVNGNRKFWTNYFSALY